MRTSKKISILVCLALCFVALLALTSCFGGDGSTEGEHVHTEEIIPGVEATCTEDGLTEGKKCSDCGEILVAQETIAASHKEEIIPAVPATCTEDGLTEGKKCSDCGKILVEQKKKDAVGKHKFENSYTCTLCNTEIYKTCRGLGYKKSSDGTYYIVTEINTDDTMVVVPFTYRNLPVKEIGDSAFLNCDIKTVILPETITTIGESAFSGCVALVSINIPDSVTEIKSNAFYWCELLENVAIGNNVLIIGDNAFGNCDKLKIYCEQQSKPDGWSESWNTSSRPISWEHTHTEEIIPGVEPTCSMEGITIGKKCSVCGEVLLEQRALRKKGHTEEIIPAVEPTCAMMGRTEGKKCSVCGEILVRQELIDPLPHTEEIIPATEPTCETEGLTEGKKCSVCDKVLVAQKIVDFAHKEEIIPAVAATCTQSGLTEGKKCSACGEILEEQKTIRPGHKFENNYTCVFCSNEIYKESQGLEYTLINDETNYYIVSGIGECSDTDIVIPFMHQGVPVTTIGYEAFKNNTSIKSVVIPDNVTNIIYGAFYECDNLTEIVIPNTVTDIGACAFYGCDGLTEIVIPNSVTSVGGKAFYNSNSLIIYCETKSGDKPSDWHSYWNESNRPVVWDCNNNDVATDGYIYTTIDGIRYKLNNGEATVEKRLKDIVSAIIPTSVTYKDVSYNVTSIASYAFYYCDSLTSVTIGDGVTSIGRSTFGGCKNITSVTIGDSVTDIGVCAFSDCKNLVEILIPNSVTSIGSYAFDNCDALTIYSETTSRPINWKSDFAGDSSIVWDCNNNEVANDGNIYTVIDGVKYALKDGEATVAKQMKNIVSAIIPASITYKDVSYNVTSIGNYAFKECYITEIVMPNGLTNIGNSAFSSCRNLTEITIPNSVTNIGDGAFWSCDGLTEVVIPNSVTSIGDSAFRSCVGLKEVIISGSVKTICSYAFSECDGLTSVVMENGVTSIGDWAFGNCYSLTSIAIPSSVTSIGDNAFRSCDGLTKIIIPNSVSSIGDYAFAYCGSPTIYCEAKSKPIGWYSSWNYSNHPVVWGHTHSYADGECVCGVKE